MVDWNDTAVYVNSESVYLKGFGRHEDANVNSQIQSCLPGCSTGSFAGFQHDNFMGSLALIILRLDQDASSLLWNAVMKLLEYCYSTIFF